MARHEFYEPLPPAQNDVSIEFFLNWLDGLSDEDAALVIPPMLSLQPRIDGDFAAQREYVLRWVETADSQQWSMNRGAAVERIACCMLVLENAFLRPFDAAAADAVIAAANAGETLRGLTAADIAVDRDRWDRLRVEWADMRRTALSDDALSNHAPIEVGADAAAE